METLALIERYDELVRALQAMSEQEGGVYNIPLSLQQVKALENPFRLVLALRELASVVADACERRHADEGGLEFDSGSRPPARGA